MAATSHLPWGLEVSPILQFGSARPYLAIFGNNALNLGGGSAAGALIVTNAAPNDLLSATKLTPIVDTAGSRAGTPRIDIAEAACYYSGNCHIAPYNSLRGNPYFDVDARLAKNIKLGERAKLQLVFQAFNLFNHANYGNNFSGTTNSLSFIKDLTTLSGQRQVSTPDPSLGNPLGFINPTSSTLPRAFTGEFGARFTF
jgi:hypothetical protein